MKNPLGIRDPSGKKERAQDGNPMLRRAPLRYLRERRRDQKPAEAIDESPLFVRDQCVGEKPDSENEEREVHLSSDRKKGR